MDPLCGWCYGNSKTLEKLWEKYNNTYTFTVLPGGMWTKANIRTQNTAMVNYFMKHDKRIEELTGVKFGMPYIDFIQKNDVELNSEIPSRAIVTIKDMAPEKTVPFAIAVQKARYFYGKDLNPDQTYIDICQELEINSDRFIETFHSKAIKLNTEKTFQQVAVLASSYPTLLLKKDGIYSILEQGYLPFEELELKLHPNIKTKS
ncbi:DsbA family protein [Ancylomarina salipaludis]|uniref:DsbA family protein n=2 Tax=Ancylomarina salipaludis TaxID=2501299 RepID=A0A4Q1JK70_9BACT|nr:DsbA family protein [Ancylomarina salipaludis]